MRKDEILPIIKEDGLIAVLRCDTGEQVLKSVEAIVNGGIRVLEVTMTVPGAMDLIRTLSEKYRGKNVVIGAGSILDAQTARICMLSGAEFLVCPSLDIDSIKICNKYGVLIIPGIMTVSEAVKALEYGVTLSKIFPADVLGSSVIKAFKGPIPQADFMPTGGITLENAGKWIRAGAVAVAAGGELTRGAKDGDYALVTQTAMTFVSEVQKARNT